MMTYSNIFCKKDLLSDPVVKVKLYNPAGKVKDFMWDSHVIFIRKNYVLFPVKINTVYSLAYPSA